MNGASLWLEDNAGAEAMAISAADTKRVNDRDLILIGSMLVILKKEVVVNKMVLTTSVYSDKSRNKYVR